MTGPQLPSGTGFGLLVPPGWHELPLHPATRQSGLQELLARLRDVPELRPHRAEVARLLTEQVQRAWDSGAAFAASMLEPTEDGPVVASAVVQVVPGPLGVAETELLDALAAPLPSVRRAAEGEPWRETTIVPVQTTAGGTVEAVRAAGVDDVDLPDDAGAVRLVLLQLLVPLRLGRVLVLTCSSPVLPLEDVLLDLFDAVASTLEVELPQEVAA